jgi:hypothetical protein
MRVMLLVVLAGLAGGLWLQVGRSFAQEAPVVEPTRAGASVIAVTGQVTRDSYGIYLVDTEQQTICVYQFVGTSRILRLLASRTYAFDMMLDAYNTEPSPRQIRALAEEYNRLTDDQIPPLEPDYPDQGED